MSKVLSYWTNDIKMTSKVQPAEGYWTLDQESLGMRLCYFWWAEKQSAKLQNSSKNWKIFEWIGLLYDLGGCLIHRGQRLSKEFLTFYACKWWQIVYFTKFCYKTLLSLNYSQVWNSQIISQYNYKEYQFSSLSFSISCYILLEDIYRKDSCISRTRV